jgi:hypothetical protein
LYQFHISEIRKSPPVEQGALIPMGIGLVYMVVYPHDVQDKAMARVKIKGHKSKSQKPPI